MERLNRCDGEALKGHEAVPKGEEQAIKGDKWALKGNEKRQMVTKSGGCVKSIKVAEKH